VAPIFIASLAAYGFTRFSLPIKNYIFLTIVTLLALPPQIVAIPIFSMLRQGRSLDTHLGLIIIQTAWGIPWIIFFLRNYFSTLPVEVEEAARVDGASDFTIFYKIVLPMSIPALVSVAALQFVWTWNDLFFALITLFSPEKMTAIQCLPQLRDRFLVDWELLSAASVMVSLVPIGIFAFLQRYYIKGMVGWVSK
jgi:multiple sugar transport system permease protein